MTAPTIRPAPPAGPGAQPPAPPPNPDDVATPTDINEVAPWGNWCGLLVPYDIPASDGRVIAAPAGDPPSREMPLPLNAQVATADAHDNAVLVGRVNRVWTQDDGLWGEGQFDLDTPDGLDWAGRVQRGMAGWGSVDLDPGDAPVVTDPAPGMQMETVTYPTWTFAGFTLVTRPAFDAARISTGTFDQQHIDHPSNHAVPPEVAAMTAPVKAADKVTNPNSKPAVPPGVDDDHDGMAVGGEAGLPLADPATAWDGAAADQRVRAWAGVDGDTPDWGKYGQAFFWHAPDPTGLGDFKLGFADVVNGRLTAVPRGIYAAAAALQGARGGVDIPAADLDGVKARIGGYYAMLKAKPPWESQAAPQSAASEADTWMDVRVTVGEADSLMAGLVVGTDPTGEWLRMNLDGGAELICHRSEATREDATLTAGAGTATLTRAAPPAEWFTDPGLDAPTPIQIGDDGRVFGHLATWGTCHIGFGDACVTAPKSATDYAYFHVGETITAAGDRISVGKVTLGTGHAGPGASFKAAASHYDNTGSAVAEIRAGEDRHGIWIAGALLSAATPQQIATLRKSPLSGDWRRIGASLELVAALAVNVPGFPIPRPRAGIAQFRQASLVAAGVIDPAEVSPDQALAQLVSSALEGVLNAMAERRARAAAASARMRGSSLVLSAAAGEAVAATCSCQR